MSLGREAQALSPSSPPMEPLLWRTSGTAGSGCGPAPAVASQGAHLVQGCCWELHKVLPIFPSLGLTPERKGAERPGKWGRGGLRSI